MFPAPTLPAYRRLDGAVLEPVGGHLFQSGAVDESTGKSCIALATSEGMRPTLFSHVAVLYAREDSIYKTLSPHVYDIHRDARHYNGPFPVVAHPPCRAWGKLRFHAKPRPDEKALGFHAVQAVRTWGGVLEHPALSTLWTAAGLPLPREGRDDFGGWSIQVPQFWWGHRAMKATWLYIVGCEPSALPDIPFVLGRAPCTVGLYSGRDRSTCRPSIAKSEYEATPPEFARWLLDLAERCAVGFRSGFLVTPGLSLTGETE